jgi:putative endonuclease
MKNGGISINKRKLGDSYENVAILALEKEGYQIIEKNFRCKSGEIDIVAKDKKYICFVEVKYRRTTTFGYPGEAINFRKQRTIYNTARVYLKKHGLKEDVPCRFDAVLILDDNVKILKNAFGGF